MGASEQLDDVLDDWEEVLRGDPNADLDEFIRAHVRSLANVPIEKFREKAAALATIDRQLQEMQGNAFKTTGAVRSQYSNDLFGKLRCGYEPIEGYRLVERLGEGGFGQVWKATDSQGFSVAIKFVDLRGHLGEKELRSLSVIKDVRHPHLLAIFGTRRLGNILAIAMELADRSLQDRFEEARKEGFNGIPQSELLRYMAEAAEALDFLNDPGSAGRDRIQHCDIKPANLLLSGNSVKVADYGLALSLKYNVTPSSGSTPAFAAPEFFSGDATSRSDQYSLAVTYCYLRSGQLPFEGDPTKFVPTSAKRNLDLSRLADDERTVVARALSLKPKDRWASSSEFVQALVGTSAPDLKVGELPSRRTLGYLSKCLAALVFTCLLVGLLRWAVFNGPRNSAVEVPEESGLVESTLVHSRDNRLETLVAEFPLSFIRYNVDSVPGEFPGQGRSYSIWASINSEQYEVFADLLEGALTPLAKAHDQGVLGLPAETAWDKSGIIEYGVTSPESLTNAIHSAVGYSLRARPAPQGCVVLVGQQFNHMKWGKQDATSLRKFGGGESTLNVKWFWISESAAVPLYVAFRRAREIECRLMRGSEMLLLLRPERDSHGRLEPTALPGGPCGRVYGTGTGGGNLNIDAARLDVEQALRSRSGNKPDLTKKELLNAERVLLFMPGFLEEGDFVGQVKVTDLPAELIGNSVDGLSVRVELPK